MHLNNFRKSTEYEGHKSRARGFVVCVFCVHDNTRSSRPGFIWCHLLDDVTCFWGYPQTLLSIEQGLTILFQVILVWIWSWVKGPGDMTSKEPFVTPVQRCLSPVVDWGENARPRPWVCLHWQWVYYEVRKLLVTAAGIGC